MAAKKNIGTEYEEPHALRLEQDEAVIVSQGNGSVVPWKHRIRDRSMHAM